MKKQVIIIIRNAKSYDFGGGERFPIYLSEVLKTNGLKPITISHSKKLLEFAKGRDMMTIRGPWWSFQDWSSWRIIFIPLYVVWQLFLVIWYLSVFLIHKPKAVHIQSKDDFISATVAARLIGARTIWTDHADLKHIWKNIDIWFKNPTGHMVYWAAHLAHNITVVSQSEMREVSNNLSGSSHIKSKLSVVYNGCADLAKEYTPSKQANFIFCLAGRVVTDKGVGEAIKAFQILKSKYKDIRLNIIGDGPEMKKFRSLANSTSGISFLGHMNEPFQSIINCDVFLLPTYHEGFSVALVEACMLGMPIIATRVGGNVEIIKNEETGLLVHPKSVDELVDAMERLYIDNDLREKISDNVRKQYLEKFIFDNIVRERFMPLYEKNSD